MLPRRSSSPLSSATPSPRRDPVPIRGARAGPSSSSSSLSGMSDEGEGEEQEMGQARDDRSETSSTLPRGSSGSDITELTDEERSDGDHEEMEEVDASEGSDGEVDEDVGAISGAVDDGESVEGSSGELEADFHLTPGRQIGADQVEPHEFGSGKGPKPHLYKHDTAGSASSTGSWSAKSRRNARGPNGDHVKHEHHGSEDADEVSSEVPRPNKRLYSRSASGSISLTPPPADPVKARPPPRISPEAVKASGLKMGETGDEVDENGAETDVGEELEEADVDGGAAMRPREEGEGEANASDAPPYGDAANALEAPGDAEATAGEEEDAEEEAGEAGGNASDSRSNAQLPSRPMPGHSSHAPPPSNAMIRSLLMLELKFAAIRDRLYIERMEEAAEEEEMLLNGTHPALQYLYKTLATRRERLHEVASRRYAQVGRELVKARETEKEGVWTWWTDERDRLHWEEFEQTWSKRRRLAREKNEMETPKLVKAVPRPDAARAGIEWTSGATPTTLGADEGLADLALMEHNRRHLHSLSRQDTPSIFAQQALMPGFLVAGPSSQASYPSYIPSSQAAYADAEPLPRHHHHHHHVHPRQTAQATAQAQQQAHSQSQPPLRAPARQTTSQLFNHLASGGTTDPGGTVSAGGTGADLGGALIGRTTGTGSGMLGAVASGPHGSTSIGGSQVGRQVSSGSQTLTHGPEQRREGRTVPTSSALFGKEEKVKPESMSVNGNIGGDTRGAVYEKLANGLQNQPAALASAKDSPSGRAVATQVPLGAKAEGIHHAPPAATTGGNIAQPSDVSSLISATTGANGLAANSAFGAPTTAQTVLSPTPAPPPSGLTGQEKTRIGLAEYLNPATGGFGTFGPGLGREAGAKLGVLSPPKVGMARSPFGAGPGQQQAATVPRT